MAKIPKRSIVLPKKGSVLPTIFLGMDTFFKEKVIKLIDWSQKSLRWYALMIFLRQCPPNISPWPSPEGQWETRSMGPQSFSRHRVLPTNKRSWVMMSLKPCNNGVTFFEKFPRLSAWKKTLQTKQGGCCKTGHRVVYTILWKVLSKLPTMISATLIAWNINFDTKTNETIDVLWLFWHVGFRFKVI